MNPTSLPELCSQVGERWRALVRRFVRDEHGVEIVQLIMILPIMVGLLWSAYEVWQIMSMRSILRSTTAQATRYVTAFAAAPEMVDGRLEAQQIRDNVREIVYSSLLQQRGITGNPLTADDIVMTWYGIANRENPQWEGNYFIVPRDEAAEVAFLQGFATICNGPHTATEFNGQFAFSVDVSIPWVTVLFGLGETSATNWTLRLHEVSMGGVPCMPYCDLDVAARNQINDPTECRLQVCWDFDCSFAPDRVEVWNVSLDPYVRICETYYPLAEPCCNITVPLGQTWIEVRAFMGEKEIRERVLVTCPG